MSLSEMAPPLFAYGFCRVDCVTRNKTLPYYGDSKFFRANPKRHAYLRVAWKNEFDKALSHLFNGEMPTLYVLVSKLSSGTHICLPVFRTNRPFWAEPQTDADVANVVAEMGRIGGYDIDEMTKFAAKHCPDFPVTDNTTTH